METVQLQCGHCRKVMGILAEHLGGQVQCPHCHAVVRTPPRPLAPVAAAPSGTETVETAAEYEPVEVADDDDLVETAEPADEPVSIPLTPNPTSTARGEPVSIPLTSGSYSGEIGEKREEAETAVEEEVVEGGIRDDAQADLASFQRKPLQRPSLLPLIFMIFLVPYSILTTAFIAYLLMNPPPKSIHPLDIMPDPKKDGGPRRVQIIHNHALADHQIIPIGKTIRVGKDGDLAATPEQVRFTPDGDLELVLRVQNVSEHLKFVPIHDAFLRYQPSKKTDGDDAKPYTFLESRSKKMDPIYGGFLQFCKKIDGQEQEVPLAEQEIGPGQEESIVIRTMDAFRKQIEEKIKPAASSELYLWRVQLRRGLVKYQEKDVPATAVIGIEFSREQITGG
jgi:hypothetical protein